MINFYRVGQALFSSESHCERTIVYDCGGENVNLIRNAIKRAFPLMKGQVIDILFISHYDRDHINGIFDLLKNCTVKTVIIPLVSNLSRFMSSKYPGKKDGVIQSFYEDPVTCIKSISPETLITYLVASNDETEYNKQDQDIRDKDTNSQQSINYIRSGDKIIVFCKWFVIPFNRIVMTKQEEIQFLKALGLPPNATFIDIKKAWSKKMARTIKKACINNTVVTKETINDYSMIVSSISCQSHVLYLGDYNSNYFKELESVYLKYWKQKPVECILIPHHGSIHSFNDKLLNIGATDYIIPNGGITSSHKRNYVNPNDVIEQILLKRKKCNIHMTDITDVVI